MVQPIKIQYIGKPEQQHAPQSNSSSIPQPVSQQVPESLVQPVIQQNLSQAVVYQYVGRKIKPRHRKVTTNDLDLKVKLYIPILWTWIYFIIESMIVFIDIDHISSRTKLGQIKSVIIFFLIAYLVTKSAGSNDAQKYNTALLIFVLYFIFYSGIYIYVYLIVQDYSCYSSSAQTENLTFYIEKVLDFITMLILFCYKNKFNEQPKTTNQRKFIPQRVLYIVLNNKTIEQ